ncbi:MAG: hypothetical protein KGZ67_06515 [Hydrogenophaga sp.]|nr:hypothetical protein [Hydrogenophaga sp.]
MSADVLGWLLAGAGFVIAFVLSRKITHKIRQRRQARAQAEALGRQSRQVRRAEARKRQR